MNDDGERGEPQPVIDRVIADSTVSNSFASGFSSPCAPPLAPA